MTPQFRVLLQMTLVVFRALKPSGSQSPTTLDQGVLITSSGFHRYEHVYLTQTDTYSYSEKNK